MSSIDFENYVFRILQKDFSDYSILEQLTLDSGFRPDFVLENDDFLIVIEAKCKERLTNSDVEQTIEYINEIGAGAGIIYVADFTTVSETVEDYAVKNGIEIEFTNWRF